MKKIKFTILCPSCEKTLVIECSSRGDIFTTNCPLCSAKLTETKIILPKNSSDTNSIYRENPTSDDIYDISILDYTSDGQLDGDFDD